MLGKRIKKIRELIDLTQKEFARKLGVNRSHISKIESGNAEPSTQLVNLICMTFSVNEQWLKEGKGPMTWDTDLTLKEVYEFKEHVDSKAGKGILNLLSAYTSVIESIHQRIIDISFVNFKVDRTDPEIAAAKESMEFALDILKHDLNTLFEQKKRKGPPENS